MKAIRSCGSGGDGGNVRDFSAFTLIELLAVITILGIIAALSVPALKNLGKTNGQAGAARQLLDDVGRALYRCMDAGQHVSLPLGRHSNDDMLSFYPMTPSGFDIEYGWAGVEVDDETWHVVTHASNSAWGHRFQRPPRPLKP